MAGGFRWQRAPALSQCFRPARFGRKIVGEDIGPVTLVAIGPELVTGLPLPSSTLREGAGPDARDSYGTGA